MSFVNNFRLVSIVQGCEFLSPALVNSAESSLTILIHLHKTE